MAKKSVIETQKRREGLVKKYLLRRNQLKAMTRDESLSADEKMQARFKLAELPRNSSPNRLRNRCALTGRPRAYYRKLDMSRIALRDLASHGLIPGMTKSSW